MEVQIAVSKIKKYATRESGDTLEVIERPGGGISVVLADGQTSGRAAKSISNMVVRKVISLLAEGVRDGAAARAASDYLFTEKNGKVQATLNIISVDLNTRTLVLSRNNPMPILVVSGENTRFLDSESIPVGIYRNTLPVISEIPLETGMTVVVFTDGLIHAGSNYGQSLEVETTVRALLEDGDPSPQTIADSLLEQAVQLDQGRPTDDISVVVLRVMRHRGDTARRMSLRLPVDS
jgi:serine phosphatase RsbU (regulator of sigma subunit)